MPSCASGTGLSPSVVPLSRGFSSHAKCNVAVLQPRGCIATTPVWALPRSLATTGGIIRLFSLPGGTKMFQFPPFASLISRIGTLQVPGLSHSEIRGSRAICALPRLIAAYHVLHRLNEPRHPPSALSYFLLDNHPGQRPDDAHTFSCIVRHTPAWGNVPSHELLFYSTVLLVSICQRSRACPFRREALWRITDSNR